MAQTSATIAQSAVECPKFIKASDVPACLHDPHHDSKRPTFHVMPARGWASDPCGPVYYKGRYHMFYQHQRQSCQWFWGLCWDHVVSDDLVHWKNLPPAIVPTPGWYDADGCFSGTVEFDPELGVPVIMYTGVYLKANLEAVAAHGIPPPQHDPGTRFVERQLAAVPADPDDPDLVIWRKLPSPVMGFAPAGLNISCWRDPFCIQRPASAGGEGEHWVVLLASGIKGKGGAVLRFKSKHWTYGWQFDGLLADGDNTALGIKGQDWECPILAKLPDLPISTTAAATAAATETSPYVKAHDSSNSRLIQQMLHKMDSCSSSRPLLPKLGKLESKKLGICSSRSSSGSLLAVGQYPAVTGGAFSSATSATDASTISCSSSVDHTPAVAVAADTLSVSGASVVSSCSVSSAPINAVVSTTSSSNKSADAPATDGSAVEFTPEDVAPVPAAPAAATGTNTNNPFAIAAAGVTNPVITLHSVPSAPLTEPVLVAATSAAAADGHRSADASHPAVNLFAWLEQTDHITAAAVADTAQLAEVAAAAAPLTAATHADTISSNSEPESVATTGLAYHKFASGNIGSSNSLCDAAAAAAAAAVADGDLVVVIDSADQDSVAVQGLQLDDLNSCKSTITSSSSSSSSRKNWWFCMSPDACNNPITWWLGEYNGQRFDIQHADGPHRLDLGTTLYAASLWQDPQGRQVLYGWIQEHRRVPTPPNNCAEFQYAGCICTPRVLHLHNGHVYQAPLPEIDSLRTKVSWHIEDMLLEPNAPLQPLQVVSGTHLDINVTFEAPNIKFDQSSSSQTPVKQPWTAMWASKKLMPQPLDSLNPDNPRVGLVFKSWRSDGQGAAVLSFDWSNHELAVDFDAPFPDAYNPHPEDSPERRRVGGKLVNYVPGTALTLRVFVDGSVLEVFTSTGETLTTRVYRGHPPKCICSTCNTSTNSGGTTQPQQDFAAVDPSAAEAADVQDETGIALFAANAAVTVSKVDVWEMGACWAGISPVLLEQLESQQQAVIISAAALADCHAPDVVNMMNQRASTSSIVSSRSSNSLCSDATGDKLPRVFSTAAAAAMAAVGGADNAVHVPAGEEAFVDSLFLQEMHINPASDAVNA